jgi:hypothetical protein
MIDRAIIDQVIAIVKIRCFAGIIGGTIKAATRSYDNEYQDNARCYNYTIPFLCEHNKLSSTN